MPSPNRFSEPQRPPERLIDTGQVIGLQGAKVTMDHRGGHGPNDPGGHGRTPQTGFTPLCYEPISEQSPANVARDGGHDHLAARPVIGVGTEHDGRSALGTGRVGEEKIDQHDVAPLMARRTLRQMGCPRAPRVVGL